MKKIIFGTIIATICYGILIGISSNNVGDNYSTIELQEEYAYIEDNIEQDDVYVFSTLSVDQYQAPIEDNYMDIIYSHNDKLILSSNSRIILLEEDATGFDVVNTVNLKDIDEIIISDKNRFSVSDNGEKIILIGEHEQGETTPIIYIDMYNDVIRNLGNIDYVNIIDDWSDNGRYYVYANQEGESIQMLDTETLEVTTMEFGEGNIKSMYINDNAEICVEVKRNYILKPSRNYTAHNTNIQGQILAYLEDSMLYYDKGNIYSYQGGQIHKKAEIGVDYDVINNNNRTVLFSNRENIKIYKVRDDNILDFNVRWDDIESINISDTADKVILKKFGTAPNMYSQNGYVYELNPGIASDYLSSASWYNDDLVRIEKKENVFVLSKLNIENESEEVIYLLNK